MRLVPGSLIAFGVVFGFYSSGLRLQLCQWIGCFSHPEQDCIDLAITWALSQALANPDIWTTSILLALEQAYQNGRWKKPTNINSKKNLQMWGHSKEIEKKSRGKKMNQTMRYWRSTRDVVGTQARPKRGWDRSVWPKNVQKKKPKNMGYIDQNDGKARRKSLWAWHSGDS